MGATVDQIEKHIDSRRAELGAHLDELERKVGALTDWREHFRARPWLFVAGAFAGGALLAASLGPTDEMVESPADPREAFARVPTHRDHVLDAWEIAKAALIGLAIDRVKHYAADLIPGFGEQFDAAEQRRHGH
jgi:hypothetical protein